MEWCKYKGWETYRSPLCRDKLWLTPRILGKKAAVFDEFDGERSLSYPALLSLTDPWNDSEFESKGDFYTVTASYIFIITNALVSSWYPMAMHQLLALARRIRIINCGQGYKDKHDAPFVAFNAATPADLTDYIQAIVDK